MAVKSRQAKLSLRDPKNWGPLLQCMGALGCSLVSLVVNPALSLVEQRCLVIGFIN